MLTYFFDIVVGYAIVYEFSDDGSSPYNRTNKLMRFSDKKYYYLDSFNMFISENSYVYDVLNNISYNDKEKITDFINSSNTNRNSTAPSIPIIDPDDYEKGYSSLSTKSINGWDNYYMTTGDFSATGHCGATSAVNLLLYYYQSRSYYNLYDNNNWQTAFSTIYSYAGYNASIWDVSGAINRYFFSKNYNSISANATILSKDSTMMGKIDNNVPFILNVMGHNLYEEHFVLALGYRQYQFSNGTKRIYYKIADGWVSRALRYICPADASMQNAVYISE
ncbi:hypothetical protein Cphy_3807 [Lachnoclostridium phytofermentans ISDg]|uniref:Peptidase C39-like domain-containing protein n=1 Tax=Lachnoclostridium phytofermentans (strain ATCC 700394 / DSM 18823 / ISDg) TaxID=357809 RepID=A9KKG3_LACP7|nr:hypothetical protein Cphy_3807 [Lachnoclostridium phytofermentans ISDg]